MGLDDIDPAYIGKIVKRSEFIGALVVTIAAAATAGWKSEGAITKHIQQAIADIHTEIDRQHVARAALDLAIAKLTPEATRTVLLTEVKKRETALMQKPVKGDENLQGWSTAAPDIGAIIATLLAGGAAAEAFFKDRNVHRRILLGALAAGILPGALGGVHLKELISHSGDEQAKMVALEVGPLIEAQRLTDARISAIQRCYDSDNPHRITYKQYKQLRDVARKVLGDKVFARTESRGDAMGPTNSPVVEVGGDIRAIGDDLQAGRTGGATPLADGTRSPVTQDKTTSARPPGNGGRGGI